MPYGSNPTANLAQRGLVLHSEDNKILKICQIIEVCNYVVYIIIYNKENQQTNEILIANIFSYLAFIWEKVDSLSELPMTKVHIKINSLHLSCIHRLRVKKYEYDQENMMERSGLFTWQAHGSSRKMKIQYKKSVSNQYDYY